MVINDTLTYNGDKSAINPDVLKYVEKVAAMKFKETLNIRLTDDEIYYICEIFEE